MSDYSRFMVVENDNHKYHVVDRHNGEKVCFGYNFPPLYSKDYMGKSRYGDEWDNYFAARGFAQKLAAKQLEEVCNI